MQQISDLRPLAERAYYGNYTDHKRVADNAVKEYTADLQELLSKIPAESHGWVTERYIKLLSAWLGSQTSTYSWWISGASSYPVARQKKLQGWADNHYQRFKEFRENVVQRIKRAEKRRNYTLANDIEEQIEKLADLEKAQEIMKSANKICRDKKTTEEEKIAELIALGIQDCNTDKLLHPKYSYQSVGYQPYSLSNNNACIRNTKARIAELQKRLDAQEQENESYEINGVRVENDIVANRIKLFFPSKPDEQMRTTLKKCGFRWSPSNECWQAYPSAKWHLESLLNEYQH